MMMVMMVMMMIVMGMMKVKAKEQVKVKILIHDFARHLCGLGGSVSGVRMFLRLGTALALGEVGASAGLGFARAGFA